MSTIKQIIGEVRSKAGFHVADELSRLTTRSKITNRWAGFVVGAASGVVLTWLGLGLVTVVSALVGGAVLFGAVDLIAAKIKR
jgi:uncharacterized membrane protein YoaK (UPF0700 family)